SHPTDLAALRPLIREHGMALEPIHNARVEAQLPRGSLYLSMTRGMCDCGTVLGCLSGADRDPHRAGERDREQLRRKGMGEAKIARWAAERDAAREKWERERSAARETRREEAERWLAFLRAVLQTGRTHCFGLLLHWYAGAPATEKIDLLGTRRIPI